ncbi:Peroxiredoxin-2E [Rhynchospora pubera]|uniref:Glutaredoxin-dependent peroxiredoxin n=1 Tax=Rhynchospora pubera TaxID=906938 RepID=A0AAV8C7I8_9POAL|nr:Peroxiredoxin-2E [Rhynchospora pubera]
MATATTTAASFSTAVRRLCVSTSTSIRLRHVTTSARPPTRLISTPTPHRLLPLLRFSATASPSSTTVSTISVGDKLPDATLSYFGSDGELKTITISDLTKGKKTVLFAVPGAFTPTCSQKHLPGFVEKAKELKAKGVDVIACVSVNDAFVMKAWKEDLKVGDEVLLVSDGNGVFTKALGVELDLSDKPVGLGVRSRRYSLLAEDGVVKVLNLEEGGSFTNSGAEDILKAL